MWPRLQFFNIFTISRNSWPYHIAIGSGDYLFCLLQTTIRCNDSFVFVASVIVAVLPRHLNAQIRIEFWLTGTWRFAGNRTISFTRNGSLFVQGLKFRATKHNRAPSDLSITTPSDGASSRAGDHGASSPNLSNSDNAIESKAVKPNPGSFPKKALMPPKEKITYISSVWMLGFWSRYAVKHAILRRYLYLALSCNAC